MSFVLDSSLTVAWFIPDEYSAPTQVLLERAGEDGAVVPDLWRIEIGNALLLATRRKRLTLKQRAEALVELSALPIEIDADTPLYAWNETMQLADKFRLTLYDACYLELAQRRGLPLATLDEDLGKAAHVLGVTVLGA